MHNSCMYVRCITISIDREAGSLLLLVQLARDSRDRFPSREGLLCAHALDLVYYVSFQASVHAVLTLSHIHTRFLLNRTIYIKLY
jgi:hypothetical protein